MLKLAVQVPRWPGRCSTRLTRPRSPSRRTRRSAGRWPPPAGSPPPVRPGVGGADQRILPRSGGEVDPHRAGRGAAADQRRAGRALRGQPARAAARARRLPADQGRCGRSCSASTRSRSRTSTSGCSASCRAGAVQPGAARAGDGAREAVRQAGEAATRVGRRGSTRTSGWCPGRRRRAGPWSRPARALAARRTRPAAVAPHRQGDLAVEHATLIPASTPAAACWSSSRRARYGWSSRATSADRPASGWRRRSPSPGTTRCPRPRAPACGAGSGWSAAGTGRGRGQLAAGLRRRRRPGRPGGRAAASAYVNQARAELGV